MNTSISVMIVDDDAFFTDLIVQSLRTLDVQYPLAANSGRDALSLLDAGHPVELLLCDLNMPEMDGVELLRHLAHRGFNGNIALLSGADLGVLEAAKALAAAHQLQILGAFEKPLPRLVLHNLLERTRSQPLPRRPTDMERSYYTPDDLRRGITAGEIVAHYQPRVEIATGQVLGVEALARWQHPTQGLIYPDRFIPLAEHAGLIGLLTQAMLTLALRQTQQWLHQGLDWSVGVNVSMETLANVDFPDELAAAAASAGVPLTNLVIEVTESQLLSRINLTLDTLTRLRLKGVRLAIDDFGTGYASLEQLRRIPFTELKVDRQFVNGAATDSRQRAFLEMSLDLADKLGMSTIAEGVETVADWDLLAALGCKEAQGYLMAKPMPPDDLPSALHDWRTRQNTGSLADQSVEIAAVPLPNCSLT